MNRQSIFRSIFLVLAFPLATQAQRIPDLPAITGAAVDPATDLLWINDTSAGNNSAASKKITLAELVNVSSFKNDNFLTGLGATATGISVLKMSEPGNDKVLGWNFAGVLTPLSTTEGGGGFADAGKLFKYPENGMIRGARLHAIDSTDSSIQLNLFPTYVGRSNTTTGNYTRLTFDAPSAQQNVVVRNTAGTLALTSEVDLTSGPVTSSAGVSSIANSAITNAMLANSAVANLSGVNTGDETADGIAAKFLADSSTAAIVNDPRSIIDTYNWQPYTSAKMLAWEGGTSAPLRVVTIGDSLSTGLMLAPSMGNAVPSGGVIGLSKTSGSTSVSSNTTDWLAPINQIAVGGSAVFHVGSEGSATVLDQRADRLMVAYIRGSGLGSFDLQTSSNAGSSWTTVTTISTANATADGVVYTSTLSTSNTPAYRIRINNVTTGAVKIVAVGLYNSTGGGVIHLRGLANLAGIDIVNFGSISNAVFTPIWTGLAPDLALVCFADAPEDWQTTKLSLTGGSTTNGSATINFSAYPARVYEGGFSYRMIPQVGDRITGTGIPTGTYITAHSEGTTSATISQNATATNSGITFNIPGAWTDFYTRSKTAYSATDYVQVSMNPVMDVQTSGHARWVTATPYVIGDRVVRISTGYTVSPAEIYVCTSNHTSGASTEPGTGGSWATVWSVDSLDPAAIAAGDSRAYQQANAQRTWAVANNETFINGFGMYRGYSQGVTTGLLAGDKIHPSTAGHRYKNLRVWDMLPISRLYWGAFGAQPATEAIIQSPNASNITSGALEITRALQIRQSSLGGLTLWDRSDINAGANARSIYADSGNLHLGAQVIAGQSSFQGLHPSGNGLTIGGRGSFWWNLGGAGMRLEYVAKTADYTLTAADYVVDVTANSPVITLPDSQALNATVTNYTNAAAGALGKIFVVKNTGGGTVSVTGAASTRTGGVTNGTTTITYTSNGSAPNVGDKVSGTDIPANTYIVTAGSTTATLNQAATGSNTGITFTFNESIDGVTPQSLTTGQSLKIQSKATGWLTIP